MSLGYCIPDMIASGKLSGERAERARVLYDELLLQHRGKSQAEAEALATRQVLNALEKDNLNQRRQAILQARAQGRIEQQARQVFNGGRDADGPISGRGLLAHLVRDEQARGIANVEYRWRNIKQTALGRMYDLLAKHRTDVLGRVRNKAELDEVVRELHGEASGNLNAREVAASFRDTAEWLRTRFNAAGGAIGRLESWALPQAHNPRLVGEVSREQWIDGIIPMLDRARMVDDLTDQPLSDAALRNVLADVYESIVSEGWNRRAPGGVANRAVGNRHAEHRFLHFRSADDWLAYQERFGAGSAFDAMMGHIERMSRDIAAIEILGPNPTATIRWMGDLVEKEAATRGGRAARADVSRARNRIDSVWSEITGENRRVVWRNLALAGSTIRNWQTSSRLGSAVLASMSDHATRALVRHFNGLPALQMTGQYLRQLNPADSADRAFARRAGIIGDEFTGRMAAQGRMHMEEAFGGRLAGGGRIGDRLEQANEISRRLADGVLRGSGLNAHTVAGREAAAMEFMNAVTTFRDMDFDALNPGWRGFLSRYGMGRGEWDRIRTAPLTQHKGADWFTPDSIADLPLRDRFMEAMLSEIEYAIPTGGLYVRAMIHAVPPGTIMGELIRTGFQFKMFPVTVIGLHGYRALAQANISQRALYATAFLATTSMAGALSFQLAEIAKGKDPRPMNDPDFLWRAMLKGGGLGVFGDALQFSRNEYGQSVGDIMAGPGFTTVQTLATTGRAVGATLGASDEESEDQAGALRGRAAQALLREVPGSSVWFIRAAYERLLVDTVAQMADPNYADRIRRMEQRAAREGTRYFAPPGDGTLRAPDLSNALADPDEAERRARLSIGLDPE
jgi:polyhydroxyalkanoate synthesis regulator phasin